MYYVCLFGIFTSSCNVGSVNSVINIVLLFSGGVAGTCNRVQYDYVIIIVVVIIINNNDDDGVMINYKPAWRLLAI